MSHEINASNTYAAIDLGSNSFHMAVAAATQTHLQMIDKLRRPVRLRSGLDDKNNIAPDTMERALSCLAVFQQRLRGVPVSQIRCVGTNTLRCADNAEVFNSAAEQILGVPIEIISGREEARLIFTGVTYGIQDQRQRLVVDIGGGSTEFIAGHGTTPELMESTDVGCVSSTQKWFSQKHIKNGGNGLQRQFEKAINAVQIDLQPICKQYQDFGWDHCVGSSGTIKAAERIVLALGLTERGITADALEQAIRLVCKKGDQVFASIDSISNDRMAVIYGGLSVLLACFRSLNIEFMSVSHSALREGVIVDLGGEKLNEHVRHNAVADLKRRFQIDADQATRVRATATRLFEQVRKPWDLTIKHDQPALMWAADLHEIGLSVSHSQYHKHGDYLLRNADILGFSRKDQAMLASLVRNHRRSIDSDVTKGLSTPDQQRYPYLLLLLRLSVLFQRTRGIVGVPPMELIAGKKNLKICIPSTWLELHPLTTTDILDETERFRSLGIELVVESVSDD